MLEARYALWGVDETCCEPPAYYGTCSPPLAARLAARSAQPMVRTASLSTGRVHQCHKLAVRPLQAGAQHIPAPVQPQLTTA